MTVSDPARYDHLITLAEQHYARQGFVKWTDLATELGVSRQRILQMLQRAVCLGQLTTSDLERYRSEASRRAASRTQRELRAATRALTITITLTPDNKTWLTEAGTARPGTTPSDLINLALTHYRNTHA
jgi:Mn-dependent DtxR family transcriptional regulator